MAPGNRPSAMLRKLKFYERYGVQEYYIYDPDDGALTRWIRRKGYLALIVAMDGWQSPLLQVRFVMDDAGLELYRPDGHKFLPPVALDQRTTAAKKRAADAEALLVKYRDRFGDLE